MSDMAEAAMAPRTEKSGPTKWHSTAMAARVKRRYARERAFKYTGLGAIALAGLFLLLLIGNITLKGVPGFFATDIRLEVDLSSPRIAGLSGLQGDELASVSRGADFGALVREALMARFPDVSSRRDVFRLLELISRAGAAETLRAQILADPSILGTTQPVWLPASEAVDQIVKGHVKRDMAEGDRQISDRQIGWVDALKEAGNVRTSFNWDFFGRGASREAELAGIGGAIMGSLLTLIVTLAVAFPVGVLAAIYLEEFAPQNRWTDLIEVNINNLAAVPSIVFGLLGLAVFLNTFHLPRSAPLVGGLTLALMTLPTIIIAARAALKAVPPSIRDAARGLGASPMQVVFHHVVPLAFPGILTGTIIGMAQALGETAPLLMIGMVAFIVDIPGSVTDAATVLPVQIYMWADFPERGFQEKTSAAIMVLLGFLIAMNALAVWLRNRFEKRW